MVTKSPITEKGQVTQVVKLRHRKGGLYRLGVEEEKKELVQRLFVDPRSAQALQSVPTTERRTQVGTRCTTGQDSEGKTSGGGRKTTYRAHSPALQKKKGPQGKGGNGSWLYGGGNLRERWEKERGLKGSPSHPLKGTKAEPGTGKKPGEWSKGDVRTHPSSAKRVAWVGNEMEKVNHRKKRRRQ